MEQRPVWKPVLIVLIIAMCFWMIKVNPPKPGMDLAGGFVLTYHVEIPDDQPDAAGAIDQIIKVLSQRVDPNGVRNLVWRRVGNSRLEIQAALAEPVVRELRAAYIDAFDAVKDGNISRYNLEAKLKLAPTARSKALDEMAGDNEERKRLLANLVAAFDAREAARKPYLEAVDQARKAQEALDKLAADAPADQKKQAEDHLAKLEDERTEKTKAFVEARKKYEPAIEAVLATNVDPADIERIVQLDDSDKTRKVDKKGMASTSRSKALDALIKQHPDRATELRAVVDAFAAYDAERGLLDDPEDLVALLRGSGVLEFRIAPSPRDAFDPAYQEYRDQLHEKGPNAGTEKAYRWFEVDDLTTFAETAEQREAATDNPARFFAREGMVGDRYGDDYYLLMTNTHGDRLTASEPGWKLVSAGTTIDTRTGQKAVSFRLNTTGGQYLGDLTEKHQGSLMAIVLDGRAMSVATIQSKIQTDGQISKSSGYTKKELDYLIRTLNAGSLKAQLSDRPISTKFFNPQMGADNLSKGQYAAAGALIAVAIFMAIYYLFAGMIANFALAANMVVILGVMCMLEATWTLPGIAGMVLTIGMAVDANVLIFERIREELANKADMRTAVRLGYEKAFSTIIDANITTLITCLILGYFATVEVKGFAVTLGIGICASMFTALFCTRVIVDYYIAWFKPEKINMLPTVVPGLSKLLHPNINWVGKRKIVGMFSIVLIVGSIILVASRGKDMLDIEFRAGTQVTFKLDEGKGLALQEARDRLDKIAGDDAELRKWLHSSSASVVAIGDETDGKYGEFSIAVLNEDNTVVSDKLHEAFADVLTSRPAVHFTNAPEDGAVDEQKPLPTNVFRITDADLGENIDRVSSENVADYIGGVAIVLDDMKPVTNIDELTDRIKSARQQPVFENLGDRDFRVIGLEAAQGEDAGDGMFSSVVVITTDRSTNYAENPEQFDAAGGLAKTEWNVLVNALLTPQSFDSVQNFSGQVSDTMKQQAITAMFLSLVAIVFYISVRFGSVRYGLAAIAALAHDVTIALGTIALSHYIYTAIGGFLGLSDFKIDLALVAAFLTIVGYSLNDTIVVFDRIRENRGRLAEATPGIINDSINQTISRTVLTSGTTFLAVLTLYAFGGAGVHGFAFCMIIGVFIGTYSSIGVAANLLLVGRGDDGDAKVQAAQAKPAAA